MEQLRYIFESKAVETGIFISVLCIVVLILEIITIENSANNKSKSITWKFFFNNLLFPLLMLFFALRLIFTNL